MNKPVYVTEPLLPSLDEFIPYLRKIWDNKWLTNGGEFHQKLEAALAEYLGVKYLSLFTNGMTALQVGLQALRLTGEVITTPFTFVATTHAIHWNSCKPVFCDIEPETLTLDPEKVESLITPQTTAIMPVHVYGYPCRHGELQRIADIYGLKLFYDAAHVFGVKQQGIPVCSLGDLAMLSFHATKVYNTFEGGALVTDDPKMKERIDHLKNFGFAGETTVIGTGINGKMDEFRAAFGLLQLQGVDAAIAARKRIAGRYREALTGVPGLRLLPELPGVTHNYAYFPILINEAEYGLSRDGLYEKLKRANIYSRRYFYPLCSDFPAYRGLPSAAPAALPTAQRAAREVLCLPIFPGLSEENQEIVIKNILEK